MGINYLKNVITFMFTISFIYFSFESVQSFLEGDVFYETSYSDDNHLGRHRKQYEVSRY